MDVSSSRAIVEGNSGALVATIQCGNGPTDSIMGTSTSNNHVAHLAASLSLMHAKLGGTEVEEVLNILLDTRFDIAAFRRDITNLSDCERVTAGHAREIMARYLMPQK